jgi:hypothetical protein
LHIPSLPSFPFLSQYIDGMIRVASATWWPHHFSSFNKWHKGCCTLERLYLTKSAEIIPLSYPSSTLGIGLAPADSR